VTDGSDPGALGRELSTAIIAFHQAIADRLGLSAADHKALEIVMRDGPLTASDLARRTRLTPSSTTSLIDRLEHAGYVQRTPDPNDRRRVLLTATINENPTIAPAYADLAAEMATMMRQFTNREQQIIHRYVTDTIAVLRRQTDRLRTTPPAAGP
jgi:DNA-binding MarR family transcriptional regulator